MNDQRRPRAVPLNSEETVRCVSLNVRSTSLRRLTGLARQDLVDEISQLREDIAYYEDLLAHENKILAVSADELRDISNRFSNKRRTQISDQDVQNLDVEDLIAEEDMVVTVTHAGYVKRVPVEIYRSQKRGGKGVQGAE